MDKKQVMTSIDIGLHQKAKEKLLNISGVLENALRERLEKIEVTTMDKCEICKRVLPKATAENPDKGLIWLNPDEIWICPKCFSDKSRKLIAGARHDK